jgi:hypothetical protein
LIAVFTCFVWGCARRSVALNVTSLVILSLGVPAGDGSRDDRVERRSSMRQRCRRSPRARTAFAAPRLSAGSTGAQLSNS